MSNETSAHALEAIRRSSTPLDPKQINRLIPGSSRVADPELEALLTAQAADGAIALWPAASPRKPAKRFWIRTPEQQAQAGLDRIVSADPLPLATIDARVKASLPGFSATNRKALLLRLLGTLRAAGKVYEYPKLGRVGPLFSTKPANPAPYLATLRKEFAALVEKLKPAGITPHEIVAALLEQPAPPPPPAPTTPAPTPNLGQRILQLLANRSGGLSLSQLRQSLGSLPTGDFDRTVLALYRAQRVYLDRHDYPASLTAAERAELVSDSAGNTYIGISLRESDA